MKSGYKIRYEIGEDSTSTNLVDVSGNGLNATASVVITDGYGKNSNGARTTQNTSGFYRLNAITSYNNFTISTVYKLMGFNSPTTTTYMTNILGFTTGSATGMFIGITGSRELVISYYNGTHTMTNTGIFIDLETWNHYALTVNNGEIKLYLNGVQVATTTSAHNIGLNLSSCYSNGSYNANQAVWGVYDDVIVWESTLSDSEITSLYKYYFSIKRLVLENPITNIRYTLSDKTLMVIPANSTESIIKYGIVNGVEVKLEELFDKINILNYSFVEGSSGKILMQPLSVAVNKILGFKEV